MADQRDPPLPAVGRTEQTLRQLDLTATYDSDPDEAVAQLHATALKEPLPDFLFALAEINYLQGRKRENWQAQKAICHYHLCAGYAYHYLFATADRKPDVGSDNAGVCRMLAPQNAFDPRFRLACDLYNQSLSKCIAAAQRVGTLDPRKQLQLPTSDGKGFTLSVVHRGFRWKPEEFGPLLFCEDFRVQGLDNHHETYGLGVPLIAQRADLPAQPEGTRYPPHVCFPVTAFFRFDGGLADLYARRTGQLEMYNPLTVQSIEVQGRTVPLQTDLTTPIAYLLNGTDLTYVGYGGFLRPDYVEGLTGVYMLEPYEPSKIPVVFVHGLLSSPMTWAPMFNDLQADPKIRENYQFWFYFYPTANPYLVAAAGLRHDLETLRARVDPQKKDRTYDQMVLCGHSMGGLVSRLLTVDSGDNFWKQVSARPFDQLQLDPGTAKELRQTLFFNREQSVRRVIFLATPHHGSGLSPSTVGRLAADLIRLPSNLMKATAELAKEKDLRFKGTPTSVAELDPNSPILRVLAEQPRPPNVIYHSIVGVIKPGQAPLESWLAGTCREEGDGVVPYVERSSERGRVRGEAAGRPYARPPASAGRAGGAPHFARTSSVHQPDPAGESHREGQMSVWFAYRSFYDLPATKYVKRFEEATFLEWFRNHCKPIADETEASEYARNLFGFDLLGFDFFLNRLAEENVQPPRNRRQLQEAFDCWGVEGEWIHQPHAIQGLDDDDELEMAYYVFDEAFAQRYPERVAWLIHEDWRLPADVGPGGFKPAVGSDLIKPRWKGEGATYLLFMIADDSMSISEPVTPRRFEGVRLPQLARFLACLFHDDQKKSPGGILMDFAEQILVEDPDCDPMEKAFLQELRANPHDETHWNVYGDWLEEHGRPRAELYLLQRRLERIGRRPVHEHYPEIPVPAEPLSQLCVEPHVAQLCHHTGTAWKHHDFDHWVLFDDLWASAHPDLANALLRYQDRWDVLSSPRRPRDD